MSYFCVFVHIILPLVVVMKRVSFSRTVTVYVADNYDRTSPWEIIARDRVRFKHSIEMTEKLLSGILTESHRDLIPIVEYLFVVFSYYYGLTLYVIYILMFILKMIMLENKLIIKIFYRYIDVVILKKHNNKEGEGMIILFIFPIITDNYNNVIIIIIRSNCFGFIIAATNVTMQTLRLLLLLLLLQLHLLLLLLPQMMLMLMQLLQMHQLLLVLLQQLRQMIQMKGRVRWSRISGINYNVINAQIIQGSLFCAVCRWLSDNYMWYMTTVLCQ